MSSTPDDNDDGSGPGSRRGALVGLIVIVVLGMLAVVLVRALRRQSTLEDCLMAGRRNCLPIETPAQH